MVLTAKSCNDEVSTPASYKGGQSFKSKPVDYADRYLMISLSPFKLAIGHNDTHNLPNSAFITTTAY
jgi:hypothetical protein